MQIDIVSEKILDDEATELIVQTNSTDLQFIGFILESFEGYCNYTTIDKKKMLLRIIIPKNFKQDVEEIINYLKDYVYD
ncbi:MAG: DUF4911 domain-containing protein [Candidatus Cloacimonadota bacterium]|nr:DUF4911 domain-containing protein [Candidatus Cloacimonadota bacterium]